MLFTPILIEITKPGGVFAIAVEFLNAFDILDMVTDIGCIQTYEVGWFILYFIALGVSSLLLACPAGLDKDDDDDPQKISCD